MSNNERIKKVVIIMLLAAASFYFLFNGFSLLFSESTAVETSFDGS